MADTSLVSRAWAWQIIDNILYLFEIDDSYNYVAPALDVTDGIKMEYTTGDAVFTDSSGFSTDSAPDEDSILNCRDSEAYAVLEFVKHKLAAGVTKEPELAEYYYTRFRQKYFQAKNSMTARPHVVVPKYPYAIR